MGRGFFYSLALLRSIKSFIIPLDYVCQCWEQCSLNTVFSMYTIYIVQVTYSVWDCFLFLMEVCLNSLWLWNCLLPVYTLSISFPCLLETHSYYINQNSLKWWQMSITPAVERGKEEDQEFREAVLNYIAWAVWVPKTEVQVSGR